MSVGGVDGLARTILAATALAVLAMAVAPLVRLVGRRLRPGDLVRISDGYEEPAAWLGGRAHVEGRVEAFLPWATGAGADVLVRLNDVLEVAAPVAARGQWAVLRLRFRGTRWSRTGFVSVALVEAPPRPFERSRRAAVESHAIYRRIG